MDDNHDAANKPAQASTREKISELVDGEAEPGDLRVLIAQLKDGDGRHTWDLYHQIGDLLRSTEPGPTCSADFSARFAERFAAEPVLLPPRRSLIARLGAWPTTMAAVAAAGFGFFIAPALMPEAGSGSRTGTVALTTASAVPAAAPAPAASLQTIAIRDDDDRHDPMAYIALHHRAHASLYDSAVAIRPAVLEAKSSR